MTRKETDEMEQLRIVIPGEKNDVEGYCTVLERLGARVTVMEEPFSHTEFDALLIPGGEDIDPGRYGQENTGCRTIDPKMDELQFQAAEQFLQAKKPLLGVCNGMQMINICFGGDLIQDIPQKERHQRNHGEDSFHDTSILPETWLYRIYGEGCRVNSAHHQAVGKIGTGLRVCQISDDGVTEGIEHESLPVLGVQWHPERIAQPSADGRTADGTEVYRYFLELIRRQR